MNSTVQRLNSFVPVIGNTARNNVGVAAVANSPKSTFSTPLIIFTVMLVIFLGIFAYFYEPFMNSVQNWTDSLNGWLTGRDTHPEPMPPVDPPNPVKRPTTIEEDNTTPPTGASAIVERILPPAKDVFTVSKNDFTYYDAAPLCKALGAELATYEQVKDAWQGGADWCNYGWVKGQMAVYPTQKGTYDELQQGPPEQRAACGRPGVNGGYFDNPELKFGVTCVGKKPAQNQHDVNRITSGATRPLTASGIEFENKVQRFKEDADTIGLLPFNKERWT
jgi:hypothetical protein